MKLQCSDCLQGHAAAVRLLLENCGSQDQGSKVSVATASKGVSLEHEGATITGVNAICRAIADVCRLELLGKGEEGAAQVPFSILCTNLRICCSSVKHTAKRWKACLLVFMKPMFFRYVVFDPVLLARGAVLAA